ncbi:hypothetical protein MJO29_015679 [Puccinia striiformis f. sp. tritici]|uniref:Uncharacterized protein n=1 Tax=Puccinia striiformis TaxID=27350 RepID=A0A2S4WN03_9BASI|nr:hypothetical protein MJO29_015679 [Puccinia striiformis f. sp. tritici]POW23155.1 hypothetical protein PSHT_00434 [Puccinia striiformis]
MVALTNLTNWLKVANPSSLSTIGRGHHQPRPTNQPILSRHQIQLLINFTSNKRAQALPFVMTTRLRSLRPSSLRFGIIRTISIWRVGAEQLKAQARQS